MAIQQPISWLDVYKKLIALETQLQELRQMLSKLTPENVEIVCQHPVKLEGIWTGIEITEDDLAAAQKQFIPSFTPITPLPANAEKESPRGSTAGL